MSEAGSAASNSSRLRHAEQSGAGALPLWFGLTFLAVGAVLFYVFVVRPVAGWMAARGWQPTECLIRSSQLKTGSDGDTYAIAVEFSYSVDGHRHDSDQYDLWGVSTSWGKDEMRAEIARLAPGTTTTCYYDPDEPGRAVLNRDFQLGETLMGLFPLLFFLAGIGLTVLSLVLREPVLEERARWKVQLDRTGSVMLRKRGRRLLEAGIAAALLACAGLLAWSVHSAVTPMDGARGLALVLVWSLVLAAGGWFAYATLRALAPRLRVTLAKRAVRPGESVMLTWHPRGMVKRIRSLRVTLEGREEIGFAHRLRPDRTSVFFAREVAVRNASSIRDNSATVEIPSGAMHTFRGEHNRVVWLVELEADVAGWPDIDEEFEVEVLPEGVAQ